MTAPTHEEVLRGLRELRDDEDGAYWPSCTRLDRAIAYLERPATSENLLPLQSAEGAIEVLLQMRMDIGIPSWEAHLDLVVAYLEGPTARVRKAVVAAEKHGRLWREVTVLVKPHQRKGERVLHALRRLLA